LQISNEIILGTELIDFSRTGPSDDIEDEPGNPWNDSTTPVGSHFGESGDRIRSAKIRGKTTTINKPFDQVMSDLKCKNVQFNNMDYLSELP